LDYEAVPYLTVTPYYHILTITYFADYHTILIMYLPLHTSRTELVELNFKLELVLDYKVSSYF